MFALLSLIVAAHVTRRCEASARSRAKIEVGCDSRRVAVRRYATGARSPPRSTRRSRLAISAHFPRFVCTRIYRLARDHPIPLASSTYKGAHNTPPLMSLGRGRSPAREFDSGGYIRPFVTRVKPNVPRDNPAGEIRSRP